MQLSQILCHIDSRPQDSSHHSHCAMRVPLYALWSKECSPDIIFIYLDGILIASCTDQEHEAHLHEVYHLLSDNGMVINLKNSVFGVSELTYLGHCVATSGIMHLESRVTAVSGFPVPTKKSWSLALSQHDQLLSLLHAEVG